MAFFLLFHFPVSAKCPTCVIRDTSSGGTIEVSYLLLKELFMGFVKEFKEFALKGNVVDLAIAVVIGAAFGAIVNSLVEDVVTPLLLQPALKAANAENLDQLAWGAVKYGKFLAAVLQFMIVALVLFLVIKAINRMKRKKEAVSPAPPEYSLQEKLLMEIRDSLKSNNR
jgi:large conductance mechanosensitive channel